MPRKGYVSINIPSLLINEIKELKDKNPDIYVYKSLDSFCREAIEQQYIKIRKIVIQKRSEQEHIKINDVD